MRNIKFVLFMTSICTSMGVFAVPNVWQNGYAQGFSEYSIQDAKGQILRVSCNDAAGDEYDHSAYLQTKTTIYENTNSKYPLTFLFDGKTTAAPPASTNWRNGANQWSEFKNAIAKAKKIEVFINNKKITTFTPTAVSIKQVAQDISSCEPKL